MGTPGLETRFSSRDYLVLNRTKYIGSGKQQAKEFEPSVDNMWSSDYVFVILKLSLR